MRRRPTPTANVRVPRHAPTPHMTLSPARPDGTRIRVDMYGPVAAPGGPRYWIGLTEENPDGTTRRQWARRYSRKNIKYVYEDFRSVEGDAVHGRMTLPAR